MRTRCILVCMYVEVRKQHMDWLFNQPQLSHGQNIIAAPKISLSIFPKLLFNFVQFEKNTHRFLAISSLNGLPITWVL